jgi:hypothetical protein
MVAVLDTNMVLNWHGILSNSGMAALAFVAALSVVVLSFFCGMRKRYYLPLVVAIVCSSGLTGWGRYKVSETHQVRAETQADYKAGLLNERAQLQDDLEPASPYKQPCRLAPSSVCRVSEHNARIREINHELRQLSVSGITTASNGYMAMFGKWGIMAICAIGLPIVNGALSGCCGWLIGRRKDKKASQKLVNEYAKNGDYSGNVTRLDRFKKKLTGMSSGLKTGLKKRFPKRSTDPRTGSKETGPVKNEDKTSLDYYQSAKKAVLSGSAKPSTTGLRDHGIRGRREDLQEYLRRMAKEGVLIPPAKNGGRYKLNSEYSNTASITDYFRKQTA